jgi:hypothetical protein
MDVVQFSFNRNDHLVMAIRTASSHVGATQGKLLLGDGTGSGGGSVRTRSSLHAKAVRASILLVKNYLSFVLDVGGYASVDPGADSTTIPVLLTSAGENQLPIKLFGSPPEMLSIRSCSLKKSLPDYQNSSNKALLN